MTIVVLIAYIILLLFSLLVLFWILSSFYGFLITRVPFVPTAARDLQLIVERVPLSKQDVIYDLGSGNGKVAFTLEKLTGAQTVGFEAMLWTHWYALLKKLFTRSQARFVRGNFFRYNWGEATVIYCYLYPPLMRRVGEKVKQDCKQGTRVIVRDFPIPNLPQVDYFKTYGNHEVFIYQI